MGVNDGQPVNAAVTNPAFLDANADDTALGKITFANISDPTVSGPTLINAQREFNAIATYTGKTINTPIATTPPWVNSQVGNTIDSLFARVDALTERFDGIVGHNHDGTDGEGPTIGASGITPIPYKGYFIQGIMIPGATGGSTDVSADFISDIPSNGPTTLGVVVNTPYNKNILRQGSGVNKGDEILDGLGNQVYGRLTESSGVWTETYFVDIAGVETPYSFGAPQDIDWYYQELFNPLTTTPVYDPMAFIPSENATADILDASEIQAGKVLLANAAPGAIASAGAKGVGTRAAKIDHTHEGVHSVGIFGMGSPLLGDVLIKAGSNITLSFDAGTLKIDSTGGGGGGGTPTVEYRTIDSGEAAAKSLTLSGTPAVSASTLLDPIGGGAQEYGVDYAVVGNILSWASLGLDGILTTGDKLRIVYWT